MIPLLPTFHGMDNENPYVHIRELEEVVATFHSQLGSIDTVRLKFFPFSLKDKAKSWLYSLRPRSIASWGEMTHISLKNIFPSTRPMLLSGRYQPLNKERVNLSTKFRKGSRTF
jgi:hypothetical protein